MPSSSIVIEEVIESLVNSGSSDSGKGQASPAIEGFTSLVLAIPAVVGPASSSVQEGTTIVSTIRGFDPLILLKPDLGIFRVSGSKALEAILPSSVVINPKIFSMFSIMGVIHWYSDTQPMGVIHWYSNTKTKGGLFIGTLIPKLMGVIHWYSSAQSRGYNVTIVIRLLRI